MNIHDIVDKIVAEAERPWMSAVWEKSGEKVVVELRELSDDPEFSAAFGGCAIMAEAANPRLVDALERRSATCLREQGQAALATNVISLVRIVLLFRPSGPGGTPAILDVGRSR